MGIGEKLDELLKSKNISKSVLARKTGIPYTTICSIISRDGSKVKMDTLVKIAEELGVPLEYFFTNKYNANSENYAMREKFIYAQETNYIYQNYREISRNIVAAHQASMPFIPFSEWLKRLDKPYLLDTRSASLLKMIESLKEELKCLANSVNYTIEDEKGYLIVKKTHISSVLNTMSSGMENADLDEEEPAVKDVPATITDDKISSGDCDRSLTTGELSQWMAKLPPNMKIRLESNSYHIEKGFVISHAWLDEEDKEKIVLYGNEVDYI